MCGAPEYRHGAAKPRSITRGVSCQAALCRCDTPSTQRMEVIRCTSLRPRAVRIDMYLFVLSVCAGSFAVARRGQCPKWYDFLHSFWVSRACAQLVPAAATSGDHQGLCTLGQCCVSARSCTGPAAGVSTSHRNVLRTGVPDAIFHTSRPTSWCRLDADAQRTPNGRVSTVYVAGYDETRTHCLKIVLLVSHDPCQRRLPVQVCTLVAIQAYAQRLLPAAFSSECHVSIECRLSGQASSRAYIDAVRVSRKELEACDVLQVGLDLEDPQLHDKFSRLVQNTMSTVQLRLIGSPSVPPCRYPTSCVHKQGY